MRGGVEKQAFVEIFLNILPYTNLLQKTAFDNGRGLAKNEDTPFHHLIEHYDEFYSEEEDEEIDLDKLERPENGQNEEVGEEKGG
ncbi:MAG: hypothetical protein ACLFQO_18320, partial [Cyclobacteriaceae bacterium]